MTDSELAPGCCLDCHEATGCCWNCSPIHIDSADIDGADDDERV